MREILGNQEARRVLERMITDERLPHALMLSGPAGVGKKLVALHCCAALFCIAEDGAERPCGLCKPCHLVDTGNYPDMHLLDASREGGISAADTRELIDELQLSPMSGTRRAVLIDNAEWLSTVSANIFLKMLEEPPANTTFFLVTANAERVLPTVRSRCHRINFAPLAAEDLAAIIRAEYTRWGTEATPEELMELGMGSVHVAALAAQNILEWRGVREELKRIAAGDSNRALTYSQALAKDRDALRGTLRFLQFGAISEFRAAQTPSLQLRWGHAVTNLTLAEHFIFERHLNAAFVLTSIFLRLAGLPEFERFAALPNSASLLSHIIAS